MRLGSTAISIPAGVAFWFFAGGAAAHSPYLLPNVFDVGQRKLVTVQGSFTETFFVPDVAMKSDDYHEIAPDGKKVALSPIYTQDLTIVEAPTPDAGTYRISTGQRQGRMSKAVVVDGKWEFLEPGQPAPKVGKVVDIRSITTADVYVTRGAPNSNALAPRNAGLEFRPLSHPNSLFVGSEAKFEVLFDGRPLAKQAVAIHFGDERYSDKKIYAETTTDDEGKFSVKLTRPGVYLAMSRHRVDAAAAGQVAASHTYSITFEATD